jgi:hypothetical protein
VALFEHLQVGQRITHNHIAQQAAA